MVTVLEENEHVRLEEDRARRIIRVVRSGSRPSSPEELATAYRHLRRHLLPEHASFGLVLDVRAAQGRNSDEWEEGLAETQRTAFRSFARVAVLVGSAAGRLQAQRMVGSDELEYAVLTDPQEADRFASGG